MLAYEKLGAFYLGRGHDLKSGKTEDAPLLYDSRDLTTHAICVGMTGSGKTGLCVSLLEEAAIDGVPSLVIDPKGDMGNLLLTFPKLDAASFQPWVSSDAARRKELSTEAFAAQQAELWKNGLASWGQSGERIQRLRDAVDFTIYTPGSEAGVPISVLDSFAAPPAEVLGDGDLLRERIGSTVTGLLGLLGVDADPLQSREHILLSTVLDRIWREGNDLDLPQLIAAIQSPPVERIGVMELDSFFPAKDRFGLAMQLNNLLAAPGFQAWMSGVPLDPKQLLYTAEGKPRVAILSIAHLSESERMFFVSLLLNQVLGWMRTQPGTTSLRALLYMDEIFGYIPPTAEPPSKRPFLTLLKQARAFGVGVVLATQNPVDLDYKGLSNTGTWFLGRLQTERDKLRVLDGLEGAGATAAGFDKSAIEQTLAGLGKRVFLMHNVHEPRPVVFHTRWAMSYLRGPLTRDQIKRLMDRPGARPDSAAAGAAPDATASPASSSAQRSAPVTTPAAATRPLLKPSIPQVFLPLRQDVEAAQLLYRPMLLGIGRVRFVDSKTKKLKHAEEVALLQSLANERFNCDWQQAEPVDIVREELEADPEPGAAFGSVAAEAESSRSFTSWRKRLSDMLYRERSLDLFRSPGLGLTSEPGEREGDFRIRLGDLGREQRDRMADKLRAKYAKKVDRLEERIRKAEQTIEREQEQAKGEKLKTAISLGATVLSALLGRKKLSARTLGRATTTARGMTRAATQQSDVERARETHQALQQQLRDLNAELETELDELEDRLDPLTEKLEVRSLRPRRADVEVRLVALAWAPVQQGSLAPLWRSS